MFPDDVFDPREIESARRDTAPDAVTRTEDRLRAAIIAIQGDDAGVGEVALEFEDGLCILEPHSTIRRANNISPGAKFDRLELEDWTQSGFFVHYDDGQIAEVSWSFIRELPPKK